MSSTAPPAASAPIITNPAAALLPAASSFDRSIIDAAVSTVVRPAHSAKDLLSAETAAHRAGADDVLVSPDQAPLSRLEEEEAPPVPGSEEAGEDRRARDSAAATSGMRLTYCWLLGCTTPTIIVTQR